MPLKLKSMNMEQLVFTEKAANVVRKNIEDTLAVYHGINPEYLSQREKEEYTKLSKRLSVANSVRLMVIREMEKNLSNIENDE